MRNWIKNIVREVIREEISPQALIISSRAPREQDVYAKGTSWLHGKELYIAKKVSVEWEKKNG